MVLVKNAKSLQTDEGQQVIKKRAWTFGSGELKKTKQLGIKYIVIYIVKC